MLTKISAILDAQLSFDWVDGIFFVKMEKIEYGVVIKYLFFKGNTPTQIKNELDAVYGDSASSITIVKLWAVEFKRGHTSFGDDERSGCPKTATTEDNIAKVHQMVLNDCRI